jgi:3'(2'), 5'-bisphosphate nucleotidase
VNTAASLALLAAREASSVLMRHFNALEGIQISRKADYSQVSEADFAAHHVISDILAASGIPVLSEESAQHPEIEHTYWLIDPLDGTDEFLSGNPEFCVLIALIDHETPVLGALGHPVAGVTYLSDSANHCVHRYGHDGALQQTFKAKGSSEIRRVMTSRSRPDTTVDALLRATPAWTPVHRGSALKCVDLLTGAADVYPRNAHLSTWDLAAGDALLRALGGGLYNAKTLEPLRYPHTSTKSPWFIGAPDFKQVKTYFDRAAANSL